MPQLFLSGPDGARDQLEGRIELGELQGQL
jgi:hypothetical protein